jgi:hypothetical protein
VHQDGRRHICRRKEEENYERQVIAIMLALLKRFVDDACVAEKRLKWILEPDLMMRL